MGMAVKYETPLYATENLITIEPRRHYRTSIKPIHWQLRSLIGVSGTNAVYYPAGQESRYIQEFNPQTHRSETIAFLSFEPRCLVARDDWICCGGEEGEFVAFRLSERKGANGDDMDEEEHDPFNLRNIDDSTSSLGIPSRLVTKTEKFGLERVNGITIWMPPTLVPACPGAYTFPVAVLANNDKHVTLVNLEETEELANLEYPDYVNRAVLSPDGRLLVAVSDDPYLYVHERVEKELPPSSSRHLQRKEYEWRLVGKHHLRGQDKDDTTVRRGSFTACFSNTGQYLAVATQYGVISVFHTDFLHGTNAPLVACFSSSNPSSDAGAVREMSFCPGPYDLLAWSEDHGAAGVADMRNGFVSRQILHLCDDESYEHIAMNPMPQSSNDDLIEERRRRLRSGAIDDIGSRNFLTGSRLPTSGNAYFDRLSSFEALRMREALDRYSMPLDDPEFMDAFRERRRRREREREQIEQLDQQQQLTREQREHREQRERERVQDYLGRRSAWVLRSRSGLANSYSSGTGAGEAGSGSTRNASASATNNNTTASRLRQRSESVNSSVHDLLGSMRTYRPEREREVYPPRSHRVNEVVRAARRYATTQAAAENDDSTGSDDEDSGGGEASGGGRIATGSGAGTSATTGRFGFPSIGDGGSGSGAGTGTGTGSGRTATFGSSRRQPWGSIDNMPYFSGEATAGAGGAAESSIAASSRNMLDLLHAYSTAEAAIGGATGTGGGNRNSTAGTTTTSGTSATTSTTTRRERGAFAGSSLLTTGSLLDWEGGMTNGARRERDAADTVDKLTAGLAWSEDGTYLYIGTQGGIFEFHVNVRGRMFHPSVEMR